MGLKPEVSIPIGMSTAAMVYGIYGISLPDVASARTSDVNDDDLRGAENVATWAAAAAVGGVYLITRDAVPLIMGWAMVVALAWAHRHARLVDPATGRVRIDAPMRLIHQDDTTTAA